MNRGLRQAVAGIMVFACCFMAAGRLWAEATAQPGPHAANFKLLNNGSGIDQYTGSLNWKYNLLTVPGRGGLDFPIDLTYNSGIGCEQEASWVGLGFGLNLGSIERSVVYIPDDMMLYHKRGLSIHQHDGWLFDDNYASLPDSAYTDGPDMWTVAVNEFGSNLVIVADSANIFRSAGVAYGPAGYVYKAAAGYPLGANWLSKYQRSYGLALRIGNANYAPESLSVEPNNEQQRHCYVSPPMGSIVQGRVYSYSGEIRLAFNDILDGYGDNVGQCSVYVYKLPAGSGTWQKHGPFSISAQSSSWLSTGVSVTTNDRFAVLCKSRRFEFEKWQPIRVDYDVEFSDWGGYYLNPEVYSDPYQVFHQGFTPRVKSFTLTAEDGRAYLFGTSNWIQATSRKFEGPVAEDSMSVAFSTSYKLTSILSPDYVDADGNGVPSDGDQGSWVRITYDSAFEIDYCNKQLKAFDAVFHRFGSVANDGDSVWQWHHIRYPSYVETPTHKLRFYLSNRSDNLGIAGPNSSSNARPKKLDSLVLYAKAQSVEHRVRKIAFHYADVTVRPTNFENWQDGQTLAWHKLSYKTTSLISGRDSTGKLTMLQVKEFGQDSGDSFPGLRVRYSTNPRYTEKLEYYADPRLTNENVDYYIDQDARKSFYTGGYHENWGYYRASESAKPGLDQQAWSAKEFIAPQGSRTSIVWESNRYLWWESPGGYPAGSGTLQYGSTGDRPDVWVDGGVQRGGVRIHLLKTSPGIGDDIEYDYTYGEGIATKPQTASRKAVRTGFIGNSQEVGYRSVGAHLTGDAAGQKVITLFTNGSNPAFGGHPGWAPSPPVDGVNEAYPDGLEVNPQPGHIVLEGIKRGLPYRQVLLSSNGDSIQVADTRYNFVLKTYKNVDLGYFLIGDPVTDGRARSIWVRQIESKVRKFDENGANPISYTTTLQYDTLNGLVTVETDSLGNGLARKRVTEYWHTQSVALDSILRRKNILDLVYSKEVLEAGSGITASMTTYDYKNFGNARVYPWHQYDYRHIGSHLHPSEIETTTLAAYDAYGNLRLKIDPSGRKTSYLWGYAGSRRILEALNADTSEVAYNGFEDSITFDGWYIQSATQSSQRSYSGQYSAKVYDSPGGGATFGPNKVIPHSGLVPGKWYAFSGWVYTKSCARLSVDIINWGAGGPDYDITASANSWQRLELVFQYPANAADGIECYTAACSDTTYYDDLRIQPVDCPMQTFAYDHATGQLQATFDANNIAAERRYFDGFGRLALILDPDGNTIARYCYIYSRIDTAAFNPNSPNSVKEVRFRSATDSTVTVTYYDGLGREVQKQVSVNGSAKIVSASLYDRAGKLAAESKPIEKSGALGSMPYETGFLPSSWTVGLAMTSGDLNSYYDADGPGPNCSGYPYLQYLYTTDPLRRLKETGYPGVTWKVGGGRTTRTNYLSNASSDVAGWGDRTLTKTKVTDEGGRVSYAYADRLGRTVQTQADSIDADTSRFKTLFTYDILGNRTKSIRQHSASVADTTTWLFDDLGRPVQEISPDGGMIRYRYDLDGSLRFVMDAVRNAANQFVYYRYDALGRKVEEGTAYDTTRFTQANANTPSFPSSSYSPKFIFRYDSTGVAYSRGRLCMWSDSAGNYKRFYKYDQLGRVIEENVKLEGVTNTLVYTYDWLGNLATQAITVGAVLPTVYYTYDMANRLAGVGVSGAPYRYDSLLYWPTGGIRTQVYKTTAAAICQTIDYKYNPRDWLSAINDTGAVSGSASGTGDHFAEALGYLGSYTGDPDSVGSKRSTYAGSTELVSYDKLGRLARWHRKEAGADTTGDEIYRYDRAGNVLYWKLGSSPAGLYHTYHPSTNRLKRITTNPQDTTTNYSWSAAGHLFIEPTRIFQTDYRNLNNWIQINKNPPDPWANFLTFVYDADRLRVKKVYDQGYYCACGDPEGASVGSDSVPVDRRRAKTSDAEAPAAVKGSDLKGGVTPAAILPGDCVCRLKTTALYLYTYDGRLVREYVNNAAQRDFVYAGGQRIGVSEKIGATFRLHYFVTDHLGSTRSFVDSTGLVKATYDYYPYGTARTSTVTTDTKRRYTGKELDDEDIRQYYYGARYLNGVTQCFNSVDPAQNKYPGWSPYCYALANPMRNTDQDGQFAFLAPLITGALTALTAVILDPNTAMAPVSANQPMIPGQTIGDQVEGTLIAGGVGIGMAALGRVGANLLGRWLGRAGSKVGEEVGEGVAQGLTKAERVAANKLKGDFGEAQYLGESGLTKNTQRFTADGRTTVPDAVTLEHVIDVKNAAKVGNTAQLRTQRKVAEQTGRRQKIVTGQKTRVVKDLAKREKKGEIEIERKDYLGPN